MKTKLKPCPACEKMIAKRAATCPHCGKNMTSLARIGLMTFFALLVLLVLIVMRINTNEKLDEVEMELRGR